MPGRSLKYSSCNPSVAVFVIAGITLAVTLAVSIGLSVVQDSDTGNPSNIAAPIRFDVLGQGSNLADLERGRIYYAQLCMSCHGSTGNGQGEWAYRVTPYPDDLSSERVRARSDHYLFKVISDGLVATPMIGWRERLSERQRWQIVAYVRHLGALKAQQQRVGS